MATLAYYIFFIYSFCESSNYLILSPLRSTLPSARSVPSWTRRPTSGTCLWSLTSTTESQLSQTPWCRRLASLPQLVPERPVSPTPARMSRSVASPSSQRENLVMSQIVESAALNIFPTYPYRCWWKYCHAISDKHVFTGMKNYLNTFQTNRSLVHYIDQSFPTLFPSK